MSAVEVIGDGLSYGGLARPSYPIQPEYPALRISIYRQSLAGVEDFIIEPAVYCIEGLDPGILGTEHSAALVIETRSACISGYRFAWSRNQSTSGSIQELITHADSRPAEIV